MLFYGDVKLSKTRRFRLLTGWLGLNHLCPTFAFIKNHISLENLEQNSAYDTGKFEHHNMQLRQVINVAKSETLNPGSLHINPNHSCAKRGTSWNTEELPGDGKINGEL